MVFLQKWEIKLFIAQIRSVQTYISLRLPLTITKRCQAGDHCNLPEVETTSESRTSHKWLPHSLNNEAAWILHVTSSTLLYSKNNSSIAKHVKLNPHFITHTKWLPKDKKGNEHKKQTLILKAPSIRKSQINFKEYIPLLEKQRKNKRIYFPN